MVRLSVARRLITSPTALPTISSPAINSPQRMFFSAMNDCNTSANWRRAALDSGGLFRVVAIQSMGRRGRRGTALQSRGLRRVAAHGRRAGSASTTASTISSIAGVVAAKGES